MSRKLLYVSDLLACFQCHLIFPEEDRHSLYTEQDLRPDIIDIVNSIFADKPLDIVAAIGLEHAHLFKTLSPFFRAYDEFLGFLTNKRNHLDELSETDGESDEIFQRARSVSHRFQEAVLDLLFDEQSQLGVLTRLYGVV